MFRLLKVFGLRDHVYVKVVIAEGAAEAWKIRELYCVDLYHGDLSMPLSRIFVLSGKHTQMVHSISLFSYLQHCFLYVHY